MPTDENPGKPAGADAPAKAEPAERLTPAEWAERKGIAPKATYPWEEPVSSDWRYAPAQTLFGWGHHAYNYQADPFKLTEDDFDAALQAAADYPNGEPPEGAIAPHAPFRKQLQAEKASRQQAAKQAEEAKKTEKR